MNKKKNNVKVCVRCRPLSAAEQYSKMCTKVVGESISIGNKDFRFDGIYNENSSQEKVFADCVSSLIDGCFEGYNATLFAYGQTGSGKTHSVVGIPQCEDDEGIIPRALRMIFQKMEKLEASGHIIKVNISFVEIYNEEFKDLIHSEVQSKDIIIREDSSGKIMMIGAKEEPISKLKDGFYYLEKGLASRTTAETLMNSSSSRSHAIFTISLAVYIPEEDNIQRNIMNGGSVVFSKLHIVDLAGSERAKRTGASGLRLKESVGINQGLMSLGKVIRALTLTQSSTGGSSAIGPSKTHVPYRESKLTRFLQDSLGGNSQTVMLACISPSDMNLHETLSTLQYAMRTRSIENFTVANIASVPKSTEDDMNSKQSNEAISNLQLELGKMKQEMLSMKVRAEQAEAQARQFSQESKSKYFESTQSMKDYADDSNVGPEVCLGVMSSFGLQRCKAAVESLSELANTQPLLALTLDSIKQSLSMFLQESVVLSSSSMVDHDCVREFLQREKLDSSYWILQEYLQQTSSHRHQDLIEKLQREISESKEDLKRDEEIFAEKVRDLKKARHEIRQIQQEKIALETKVEELSNQLTTQRLLNLNSTPLHATFSKSLSSTLTGRGIKDDEKLQPWSDSKDVDVENEMDLDISLAVAATEPDISQLMEDLEQVSREKENLRIAKERAEKNYENSLKLARKQEEEYQVYLKSLQDKLLIMEEDMIRKEKLLSSDDSCKNIDSISNSNGNNTKLPIHHEEIVKLKKQLKLMETEAKSSQKEIEEERQKREKLEEEIYRLQHRSDNETEEKCDGGIDCIENRVDRDSQSKSQARLQIGRNEQDLMMKDIPESESKNATGTSSNTASGNGLSESKSLSEENLAQLRLKYDDLREQMHSRESAYRKEVNELTNQIEEMKTISNKTSKSFNELEKKNQLLRKKFLQVTGQPEDLSASIIVSRSFDGISLSHALGKSPQILDFSQFESLSNLLLERVEDFIHAKASLKELIRLKNRLEDCEQEKLSIQSEMNDIYQERKAQEVPLKKQLKEIKVHMNTLTQEVHSMKNANVEKRNKERIATLYHEIKSYQQQFESIASELDLLHKNPPESLLDLQEELETLETEISLTQTRYDEEHGNVKKHLNLQETCNASNNSSSGSSSSNSGYQRNEEMDNTGRTSSSEYELPDSEESIDAFIFQRIQGFLRDLFSSQGDQMSYINLTYASFLALIISQQRREMEFARLEEVEKKLAEKTREFDDFQQSQRVFQSQLEVQWRIEKKESQDKISFLLEQLNRMETQLSSRPSTAISNSFSLAPNSARPSSSGSNNTPSANHSSSMNSGNGLPPRSVFHGPSLRLEDATMFGVSPSPRSSSLSREKHMPDSVLATSTELPPSLWTSSAMVKNESSLNPDEKLVDWNIHQEVLRRWQNEKDRRELLEKKIREFSRGGRSINSR